MLARCSFFKERKLKWISSTVFSNRLHEWVIEPFTQQIHLRTKPLLLSVAATACGLAWKYLFIYVGSNWKYDDKCKLFHSNLFIERPPCCSSEFLKTVSDQRLEHIFCDVMWLWLCLFETLFHFLSFSYNCALNWCIKQTHLDNIYGEVKLCLTADISRSTLHWHLSDTFIQSDLQYIQAIQFLYMCSLGIEPTTFCAANAMLYHWATGTHALRALWKV